MFNRNSKPYQLGEWVVTFIVLPLLAFLMGMGSRVLFAVRDWSHVGSIGLSLADGFNPAGMNSSNLPQSLVTYYEKTFIQNLKANIAWPRACTRMELPENSGNKMAMFMYQSMGGNATQAPEGMVGTPITTSVLQNSSTIGNYADYSNVSSYVMMTAIDPVIDALEVEMSYRFAQTINTVLQRTADGAASIDPSVSSLNKPYNVQMSTTDITTAVQSMVGRNIQGFDDGSFKGIVHPFIVGDFLNDRTDGSFNDVLKRTAEGQEKLRELPSPDGDMVPVLDWGGVRFMQSTLVTQIPNYQGHNKTALRTYIIGRDGLICISFGAKQNTQINDADWRNLKLIVEKNPGSSVSDPAKMIGGWVAYNAMFTASLVPDLVQRIRTIDSVPIVA